MHPGSCAAALANSFVRDERHLLPTLACTQMVRLPGGARVRKLRATTLLGDAGFEGSAPSGVEPSKEDGEAADPMLATRRLAFESDGPTWQLLYGSLGRSKQDLAPWQPLWVQPGVSMAEYAVLAEGYELYSLMISLEELTPPRDSLLSLSEAGLQASHRLGRPAHSPTPPLLQTRDKSF